MVATLYQQVSCWQHHQHHSPANVCFQVICARKKLGCMLWMVFGPVAAAMHVLMLLTQPPFATGCLFFIKIHCAVLCCGSVSKLVPQNSAICCLYTA